MNRWLGFGIFALAFFVLLPIMGGAVSLIVFVIATVIWLAFIILLVGGALMGESDDY